MAKKRFDSEKSANSFAKKVKGTVNDLRSIAEAKSKFTVTYKGKPKQSSRKTDWCPEDGRDFGYSNEYWQ